HSPFFSFPTTSTPQIYTLSLHDALPISHFEKMCYDNSELLKNYVHAYQATGDEFFAEVARDIIRWMDEWLSDRAHGGFYASQDADRKSTRLNSSHVAISYAVFCLKKKKK